MNKDLMVLHDDNSSFIDLSRDSQDYLRDDYSLSFVAIEDKLYVGLYKPFNSFYVEFKSTTAVTGITYKVNSNIIDVNDDSKDFKRSGFVEFEKPSDWVVETINGVEAFWVEITSSNDFACEIQGLNIVFSDDNDLKQEVRAIDNLLAKNDISFIAYHVAARNEIIQTLRNGGRTKTVDNIVRNITKWDLLEFGEIRQASKYLTLAKIFFDISENVDDKFYGKFRDYEGMFGKAFDLWIMSLDTTDDGTYEQEEDLVLNTIDIEIV